MFQVGQFVRAVNNIKDGVPFKNLTVGKSYRVLESKMVGPRQNPREVIMIKRDDGVIVNYYADRFVLAKQPGVFAAGDKVVIIDKERLEHWLNDYSPVPLFPGSEKTGSNPTLDGSMLEWAGKEAVVSHIYASGCIGLEGIYGIDRWEWAVGWLEHAALPEPPVWNIGDAVCVVRKGVDGVAPRWLDKQDKAIGKKRIVKMVHENHLVLNDGLAYQFCSVEKWKKEKHEVPKVKSLRSVIAEARKTAKPYGLCSFTFVRPPKIEGAELVIDNRKGQPCHAGLQYLDRTKGCGNGILYLIDWVGYHIRKYVTKEDQKTYRRWVQYITHESPWSPAYVQKETKNILKYGADMNIDVSGNLIASACIAMRHGNEYPDQLRAFGYWIKQGFSGNVAFLMAYTFGKPAKNNTLQLLHMGGGHSVFIGTMKASAVLSLMKNGYNKEEREPNDERKYRNNSKYLVHAIIDSTMVDKAFDGINGTWQNYAKDQAKAKTVGEGWDKRTVITLDAVKQFAAQLEKDFA